MNVCATLLVARTVWLEALRRKDIYLIIGICCVLILAVSRIQFFGLEELSKFYREIALKLMGGATALTVIVLGTRQLPREFEKKTIYPLLARPVSRLSFLLGKQLGVVAAGFACMTLFLILYLIGSGILGSAVYPALLLQHAWLQGCMILVLSSLCFLLSLLCSPDAALSLAILYTLASSIFSNLFLSLYDFASSAGQFIIRLFTWALPQLLLFDL